MIHADNHIKLTKLTKFEEKILREKASEGEHMKREHMRRRHEENKT